MVFNRLPELHIHHYRHFPNSPLAVTFVFLQFACPVYFIPTEHHMPCLSLSVVSSRPIVSDLAPAFHFFLGLVDIQLY